MVGRPPSEHKKHVIRSHQRAEKLANAQEAFHLNALLPKDEQKSLKSIANMHGVNRTTLSRLLKPGAQSIQTFNAEKGRLSPAQEDILVKWCLGLADMALGLTPKLIRACAYNIILQIEPNAGPPGKNWVSRFLARHSSKLAAHWSSPLEKNRAWCANPAAIKGFYNALHGVLEAYPGLPPQNHFGCDESGIMHSGNVRAWTVGHCGAKTTHKVNGGSRELITFLPVICANGTLSGYVVIFPGAGIPKGVRKGLPSGVWYALSLPLHLPIIS